MTDYERGYRRGRIEASAELHALYRSRILEATTILAAPIPLPSTTPSQGPAEPVQEKT
jgi:hypothetical protein